MDIIMVVDNNWNIGIDDQLLVSLPADLARFKKMTEGQVIVMGRNTFDSLPTKPLPNRINVVITSRPKSLPEGVISYNSTQEFIDDLPAFVLNNFVIGWFPHIYIVGGGNLISQLLPHCNKAFITKIDHVFEAANKSMPNLEQLGWDLQIESDEFSHNEFKYKYLMLKK